MNDCGLLDTRLRLSSSYLNPNTLPAQFPPFAAMPWIKFDSGILSHWFQLRFKIGFVILSVKNSQLKVRGVHDETEAFTTNNALDHWNVTADCDSDSGNCCVLSN